MISIEEAAQIIREHLPETRMEIRPLMESAGLRLAQEVKASEPMPGFTNSAMDGYAIALADDEPFPQPPLRLEIVGESRAGRPYKGRLRPGSAITIATGAAVPAGANQVIPVEATSRKGKNVIIRNLGKPGAHIRYQGEEIIPGTVIGKTGQKLTPVFIAHLAAFGVTVVPVFAVPNISIITTGEELIPFDQKPRAGQVRNTNSIFLSYFMEELGIRPHMIKHVPDSRAETIHAIKEAAAISDIIIISGGVSVGQHDHVKAAAESLGFKRHFWKVAQQPGKPLYFATQGKCCLFGLPGNPVSVIMAGLVYVYPVIKILSGASIPDLTVMEGQFCSAVENLKPGRTKIFLVKIDHVTKGIAILIPVEQQRSHRVSGVVEADGFTIIPSEKSNVRENEILRVYLFPWKRIWGLMAEKV